MYDKFYLSLEQEQQIKEFLSSDKVLLISGVSGCGKTELARTIFRKISIHINTSSIHSYKNIREELLFSVKKKNIMMMFQEKCEYREILIDDFDVLMKHDKKIFSELLKFLQEGKFYHSKIILIVNPTFLKNRKFRKINYIHLHLSYNLSSYYNIVTSILDERKIIKTSDEIDKLVYHSKFNLNTIHSLLSYSSDTNEIKNDNYDTIDNIIQDIIQNDYKLEDIIRLCETNESIIGLNCLENCLHYVKKDNCLHRLTKIYNNCVLSDIIETTMIKNHKWEFRNYLTIFTVYQCYLERDRKQQCKFIYNKYISKSIITTNMKNIYLQQNSKESDLIYFYIYLYTNERITKEEFFTKLNKVNKKYYKCMIQLFEYLENCKIKIKI